VQCRCWFLLFIPSTAPLETRVLVHGEDAVEMAPQHLREFLECLQLRPHRRADPLFQVLLGPPRLLVPAHSKRRLSAAPAKSLCADRVCWACGAPAISRHGLRLQQVLPHCFAVIAGHLADGRNAQARLLHLFQFVHIFARSLPPLTAGGR